MIDLIGHQFGNYRVLRLLGRGGFADVYLGEQVHLKSNAAFKVVRTPFTEEQSAAFLQEARILARLRHPHIVRVLDFAVEAGIAYLVLEYAPGGTLRTLRPKGARLPLDTILHVVRQVASALQYAHDQGFIHRDVKPENLLLGPQGEVLLSDFGLAVFAPDTHPYSTQASVVSGAGTSPYLAPEQLQGQPLPASDQYALGSVIYEWLTGTPPFQGSPLQIAMQQLSVPPPTLRQLLPDLPPAVEEVVLRALAKELGQRFACVQDLAIALERAVLGTGAVIPPSGSLASPPEVSLFLPSSEKPEVPPSTPVLRGNAPVFLTPLLGREQEVERVSALLQRPDVRVLTLVGPGGVGKTRLGLAVAASLCASFDDGVCCISLAPISDPDLVLPTIAQQFEVKEEGEQPILDLLIAELRDRHLLLLLDNLEQVVAVAPNLADLLVACPRLKLLATSRVLLHLDGEYAFQTEPLALPDLTQLPDQEVLGQQPAVALFLQRVQAIQPDFRLTAANARAIVEICVRLDGLPLAIELAAARIRLLSPHALLERLAPRLSILTRGAATLPERQQTLRRTLQWSYDLLDVHEQRLFRHLSIFVGGFTLEAAEATCTALWQEDYGEGASESVLDGVEALLEKSLLYQVKQQTGEPRLTMLETIREYGLECLVASGELKSARQVYTAYYQALVGKVGFHLRGPDRGKALDQLEQELDNLRSVLNGLLAQGEAEQAVRLGIDLFWLWLLRGSPREGQGFLERGLAARESVAPVVRALASQALGIFVNNQGNFAAALELWQTSLEIFQKAGNIQGSAWALCYLGHTTANKGEYARARQLLEESLALFRNLENQDQEGDDFMPAGGLAGGVAHALYGLAWVACIQGEYARARTLAEESITLFRIMGDGFGISSATEILAGAALNQGDYASVEACLTETLEIDRRDGVRWSMGWALTLQGHLALLQGEIGRAHTLLEESIAVLRGIIEKGQTVSRGELAEAICLLARVVTRQGDFAKAQTLHDESLALARNTAITPIIALNLESLAETAVIRGKPAWAARLWGAAESLRETAGAPLPAIWLPDYKRLVARARTALGEQVFSTHWTAGRTLPLGQILADGESVPSLPPATATEPPSASDADLTPRERDVLRLLAQGLTSAQIAEQLVIGLVTVNTHVRSIYNKLGVSSRAAATRYAIEHNLT